MTTNKNKTDKKNITPLHMWRIPLYDNTTNIKVGWKDKNNWSKNIKGNNAVITGKCNNLTGVDLDFGYKLTDEEIKNDPLTYDFVKKFGKKPTWNTYTVKTKSGGYHYYFQYEPDIKTTQNKKSKIDIRGDGGILYAPPTKTPDGEYIVERDTEIIKMPEDLKTWLLDNLYKKTTTKNITSNNNKTIKKDMRTTYFKYDIPENILREVFESLPVEYWNNYSGNDGEPSFLVWTTACKVLDCFDLWDEYNNNYDGYDYDKNLNVWNGANAGMSGCLINLFENSTYYNALELLKNYQYQPALINERKPDKILNERYLCNKKNDNNYFKKNINYITQADCGTGKSYSLQKYAQQIDKDESILVITSRKTLAEKLYDDLAQVLDKVNYYEDDNNNRFPNFDKGNKGYVTQLESIKRFSYSFPDLSNTIIFLDEFNSLLEHLCLSTTMNDSRAMIYDIFIDILNSCKQIICCDADITDNCLLFFEVNNINKKMVYHRNLHKHNKGITAEEFHSDEDILNKMHKTKKWLCPTDSYNNAVGLKKIFKDAVIITKDTIEKVDFDKHNRIIFSPKVIYGIDSIMRRQVFCIFHERSITPPQMVQMMCRCRDIEKINYCFLRKSAKTEPVIFEEVQEDIIKNNLLGCRIFEYKYYNQHEKAYMTLLTRMIYNKKCYETNPRLHFKKIIKSRGVIDDEGKYQKTKNARLETLSKEAKQDRYDNFNIANHPETNKILNIEDDGDKFKDFFLSEKRLTQHWNICSYFLRDQVLLNYEKLDLNDKTEFLCNKIRNQKTKLKLLLDIKNLANCQDIHTIHPKNALNKNEALIKEEEYRTIFNKKNKKLDFTNMYKLRIDIAGMYKMLFGNDIINSKTASSGEERKKKVYTVNKEYFKIDEELLKIRKPVIKDLNFIDTSDEEDNEDDFDIIEPNDTVHFISNDYEWKKGFNGNYGFYPK